MQPIFSRKEIRLKEEAYMRKNRIPVKYLIASASQSLAGYVRKAVKSISINNNEREDFAGSAKILILAGKGNNGNDGRELYRILKNEKSFTVSLVSINDSLKNADNSELLIEDFDAYDIIVDALFGIGLSSPVVGVYKEIIEKINRSSAFKIAVDVPSGLDADSGQALGCAVRADWTVCFIGIKRGLILNDGRDYTGELFLEKLGIAVEPSEIEGGVFLIERDDVVIPPRKKNTHKGDYGRLKIVAGSLDMAGASVLCSKSAVRMNTLMNTQEGLQSIDQKNAFCQAEIQLSSRDLIKRDCALENKNADGICLAESALKSGAGLVCLAVPKSLATAFASRVFENTLFFLPDENGKIMFDLGVSKELFKDADGAILGSGLGQNEDIIKYIEYLFNKEIPVLIDADGLNALSRLSDGELNEIFARKKARVLLTPHPMEFARLSRLSLDRILADPIGSAKMFAKKYNVSLLLKGSSSIITDGDKAYINTKGSPALAKGGSGDVLSGIAGALMCRFEPIDALLRAVYILGDAGERGAEIYGENSLLARDICALIRL